MPCGFLLELDKKNHSIPHIEIRILSLKHKQQGEKLTIIIIVHLMQLD